MAVLAVAIGAPVAVALADGAPETRIDSGPPPLTNDPRALFTFSSDPAGARFECALDDAAFSPCQSPHHLVVADGGHALRVRAIANGQTDPTPAQRKWVVDTVPPDTSIDGAPPPFTNRKSGSVIILADDDDARFVCTLDGQPVACDPTVTFADLADGPHVLRAIAVDRAGNRDPTPATARWVVDTMPPVVTFDAAPPPEIRRRSVSIVFHADERAVSFTCRLDKATEEACRSPWRVRGLSDGPHTFTVSGTDRALNRGSGTVTTYVAGG